MDNNEVRRNFKETVDNLSKMQIEFAGDIQSAKNIEKELIERYRKHRTEQDSIDILVSLGQNTLLRNQNQDDFELCGKVIEYLNLLRP